MDSFVFQWKILTWISPLHLRSPCRRRRLRQALPGFPALSAAGPPPPRWQTTPPPPPLPVETAAEVAVDPSTRSINFAGWCLSTAQNQFRWGENEESFNCDLWAQKWEMFHFWFWLCLFLRFLLVCVWLVTVFKICRAF